MDPCVAAEPHATNQVDIDELKKSLAADQETPYNWTYENGRRYASTELGHYYMPNDQPEIQRLNEQHMVLTEVKGGRLQLCPLPDKDKLNILDIGCGSGIWCIQMAEDFPTSMIYGMDVSPIQPNPKPANVEWITTDMESPWPYPEDYFDLIHLSLVHGCVEDWDAMMAKIVKHLAPGGWVEHQEFSLCRQYSLDEANQRIPHPEDPSQLRTIFRWNRLMEQAGEKRGRPLQLGPHLATFQRDAGLLNVGEEVLAHKWGTWPSDPKERALGGRTMLSMINGIEGFTTVMFTKALGWSLEDTQAFILECKKDITDDSLRKVIDLHVVYGQKPGGSVGSVWQAPGKSAAAREKDSNTQLLELGAGMLTGAAFVAALSLSLLFWKKR